MKLHRKLAKIFGYELIKRKKHPTANSHIINLINQSNIDMVLDIGANHGQFGNMLRDEGYKKEIHSFEPVSQTFEKLQANCVNDKNWFIYKLAMSDTCGEAAINVSKSSDLSSFLSPNDFGEKKYKKIEVIQKEIVEVETIDSFLTKTIQNFDKRKIFLKMDTQGYDLKVFKGSLKSIKHIAFILSELSLIPIYSGMPNYLESLRKYEEYGFVISGLYPISRNKNLSVIEMDCMLLNKKLAAYDSGKNKEQVQSLASFIPA
ncbi:MAG: FkbM family methyltransferase [Thermodesulfobacteriota bacterium]|nr:FkbM family methyltransferase [Thermodesulfobacteriota bacterium]